MLAVRLAHPQSITIAGLQITLVFSALLSAYQQPYVLKSDNRQEQFAFLGLALVLSITNSGQADTEGGWEWYHVLLVVVVFIMFTVTALYSEASYLWTKRKRLERVAKGLEELKTGKFSGEQGGLKGILSKELPAYLLLGDEDRREIREKVVQLGPSPKRPLWHPPANQI